MNTPRHSLWAVDALKAIASQLIVWHHFVVYGPMSDVVYPHATGLTDWLYEDARLAVQTFLVIGGFLAARSLAPKPDALTPLATQSDITRLLGSRYVRLARPYVVALTVAILAAALARALIDDLDTPAPPSSGQILAHLLLLHDIIDVGALSAGVWYVAVDFQLYALFVLILWSAQRLAARTPVRLGALVSLGVASLSLASLLWLNRDPSLDEWALYFFAAYSLGIMAQWASLSRHRYRWLAVLGGVVMLALALDWRIRIFVAGITAVLLAIGTTTRWSPPATARAIAGGLGRISYAVFLIHYPVVLLVGALVGRFWPDNVAINAFGLLSAWLLSLAAGHVLYRQVESRRPAPDHRPLGRRAP